jgi:hypothetical protein
MPPTVIRVFRSAPRMRPPILDWLDALRQSEPAIHRKCLGFIIQLEEKGFDLRRPVMAPLRDKIYELRPKNGRVNYRILYFFCGANIACLSHGITKEKEVPDSEITLAIKNKTLVDADLIKYTALWE